MSDLPVSEARLVNRHRMSTAVGVDATIRLSEVVYPDGSSGFEADELATGDGMTRALSAAREGKRSAVVRSALPLALTQRIDDDYPRETYPSREYRLISVFKIWAVFQYFFPYRDLMTVDWDEALLQAIPKVIDATNALEYHLAVAEMVAVTGDTHAQVSSSILEQFFGAAHPAVRVRPVEGQVVVTDVLDAAASPGIRVGDTVVAVDGETIDDRKRKLSNLLAASTPQALDRDIVSRVLRGPEGTQATLEVRGADSVKRLVKAPRSAAFLRDRDLKGDSASHPMSFKLLSPSIGYIDLRLLTVYEVEAAFHALRDAQAIVLDLRGYPNGTGWPILQKLRLKLAPQGAQLYRRLVIDPSSDSRQSFTADIPSNLAIGEVYPGKTVLLIDARAQSQSEATANRFRANAGTTIIGSPSAGANGEGAHFVVAGSIDIGLTGMGAKNPDGTQLQRVGVIPDIQISPTIAGIREGRDEVLERALQFISTGK